MTQTAPPKDAEEYARRLFTTVCLDPDGSLPISVVLRDGERFGWDLEVCQTCGAFDAEHTDDCADNWCRHCGKRAGVCTEDADYERSVGK